MPHSLRSMSASRPLFTVFKARGATAGCEAEAAVAGAGLVFPRLGADSVRALAAKMPASNARSTRVLRCRESAQRVDARCASPVIKIRLFVLLVLLLSFSIGS